jgi:hypothetical protein
MNERIREEAARMRHMLAESPFFFALALPILTIFAVTLFYDEAHVSVLAGLALGVPISAIAWLLLLFGATRGFGQGDM